MRLPIVLLVALLSASLAVLFATPACAAVTSSLQGTTLTLTGDGADDTIALGVSGTDLTVDLNADGVPDATFPLASLTSVVVNAGGGNDVVNASNALLLPLALNGEGGADDLTGGGASDTISGGDGPDQLAGARGNDAVLGNDGADRFTWNPGDGSDTLDGGAGDDLNLFNGANVNENMSLSAVGAGHVRLFRDIANITQDMTGIDTLDVRMFGGTNAFTSGAGVAAALPPSAS